MKPDAIAGGDGLTQSAFQRRLRAMAPFAAAPGLFAVRAERWNLVCDLPRLRALCAQLGERYGMLGARVHDSDIVVDATTPGPRWVEAADAHDSTPRGLALALLSQSQEAGANEVWVTASVHGGTTVVAMLAPALLADAATLELALRELSVACHAGAAQLPARSILQYGDLVRWLEESPPDVDVRGYWLRHLPRGDGTVFDLPDHTGPFRLAEHRVSVDAALMAELGAVRDGASADLLTEILLTAWAAALHRAGAGGNLCIGLRRDMRLNEEVRDVLGPLTHFVPLQCEVPRGGQPQSLRAQIADRLAELRHVGEGFNWDVFAGQATQRLRFGFAVFEEGGGEQWSRELVEPQLLTLCVECGPGTPWLWLQYDAERLNAALAAELARHLAAALEAVLRRPQQPLGALSEVSEAELQSRLHWGRQARAGGVGGSIVEMFGEAVARGAERVALEHAGGVHSYGELDESSNRLARYLREVAGGAGAVGVMLSRSVAQVEAVLGVLKAGCWYVPLEPATPAARVGAILSDASVRVLISDRAEVASVLASGWEGELILLDRDQDEIGAQSEAALDVRIDAQQIAYVIYTSGSTGKPKGVQVTHGSVCNYARAVSERLELPEDSSLAALSSVAADLGYTALYGALLSGRRLRVLEESLSLDACALAQELSRLPLTALKIVPSHLRALLLAGEPSWLPPVLILGGERCDAELLAQIGRARPDCRIFNHYGPTESTVGVLCGQLKAGEEASLGAPLAGVEVQVLDEWLQPVSAGAVGELYVGGHCLARGYVGSASLTAQRFVPHPHAVGERLYRTGDRVRLGAEGQLYFLGRADDQVKVRGYRVELNEIVQVMRGAPGVRDAALIEHEGSLYGFVTGEAGELQRHLGEQLPEYMCPQSVHVLQTLPLNSNGKVDRAALKRLVQEQREAGPAGAYRAPEGEVQTTLAQIWSELLRRPRISVDENFFALGGDSIMTIQLVGRARSAGIVLSAQQVFEHPTLEAQARVAGTRPRSLAEQGPISGDVPLTPIQRRFLAQVSVAPHHYLQTRLYEIAATADEATLREAMRALWTHHDALRLAYPLAEGARVARHLPVQAIAATELLRRIDATSLDEGAFETLLREEMRRANASLTLEGPLLRALWFDRGGDQCGRLYLLIHHLNVDGVSWRILVEDLEQAYERLARGEPVALPPKSSSFQQWARALNGSVATLVGAGERAYWSRCARAPLPGPPGDVPPHTEAQALRRHVVLDDGTAEALLGAANSAYQTNPQDLLLGALSCAFQEWRQQSELCVELESHGRDERVENVDVTRTVGWFTSTHPLWLAPPAPDMASLLPYVKERVREVPHKGLGFGLLAQVEGDASLAALTPPVKVNFFGNLPLHAGALLREIVCVPVEPHASGQWRRYLLELDAAIIGSQLHLAWTFPAARATEFDALLAAYERGLRRVLDHCAHSRGHITPSDVPESGLDEAGLRALFAELETIQ